MGIFKYKKYVLSILIVLTVFLIILSVLDGIEKKNMEIVFPNGILNEGPSAMPHGKYATSELFNLKGYFDNGYATLLHY